MKNVIAVIDIGKTNKKFYLFDEYFKVYSEKSIQFNEILDDDGFPCDDLEAIESWIFEEIEKTQNNPYYNLKAINFCTHGASLVFLDKQGKRIAPLYNYLKPLSLKDYNPFFESYDGVEEFSRKTASPAYGMLNAGLQILKLKKEKPNVWEKVHSILHYPQYLSYLFTNKITADFTSVGAHTGTWDFDKMNYHKWVSNYNINLPIPQNGKQAVIIKFNGKEIAIGMGLHDSSASIIPLLETQKDREFILLSTGTWIISMNPFSKEVLSKHQLNNNCLCFMTPQKQQIKSSMQFLGKIHEVYLPALSSYFNVKKETHLNLELNKKLFNQIINERSNIFLSEEFYNDFEAHPHLLSNFGNYETAYYQLVFEISRKVIDGINLISDKNHKIKDIFISGGFNKNQIFTTFLKLLDSNLLLKVSDCKNESAYGAALLMKDYL